MKFFTKLFIGLALFVGIQTGSYAALCDNVTGYFALEADGTNSISGGIGNATGTSNPTYLLAGIIGQGGTFASVSTQWLETNNFAGPSSYTANIWYKPTTNVVNNPLTRDLVSGANRVFNLSFSATQVTLFAWGEPAQFHQTTTADHLMSVATWYMWTIVWDAANNLVTLYKNGASFATITLTGNEAAENSSTKMSIGRAGDATGYSNAVIDEVLFATRAFTSTEVTTLYASGAPTSAVQCPQTSASTPQTMGFFRFFHYR